MVLDPDRPEDIIDAILDSAAQAHNVLLIYYVGHGVLDADGALYLATRATRNLTLGKAAYQALPFEQVGKELRTQHRIRSTVVVLDCCFSGRASLPLPDCFLITSADRDESAIAVPGAPYTVFTGQLIQLLREGDPLGPRQFTLRAAHRCLAKVLHEQGRPVPQIHASGQVGDLILTTNVAYREPTDPDEPPQQDLDDLDDTCPYRGLAPYGTADARWFRGRAQLTESLVRSLAGRVWSGGPLVVLGSSGSGKSSLLRAGLLPAIQHGDLGVPGSSGWPHVSFAPGAQPMRALARCLREFGVPITSEGSEFARTAVRRVLAAHRGGRPAPDDRLVIVVDQFEELFTQCTEETVRHAFVAALTAVADHDPIAVVVLGLRSDFHGACTAYPELVAALENAPVVVGPMTTRELCSAIEEPAELVGLAPQAGLTEILLRDVGADPRNDRSAGYDPGVLPLLSFALQETWRVRRQRMLTVAGYRATGGIELAIAKAADATYEGLDPTARTASRHILLRLVALGEDTADTRRTVDRAGLMADSSDTRATEDALHAFAAARLLTLDKDTVEITHEALIRSWPRLRGWIDADHTGNRIRQRIAADADEWLKANRDSAHLYAGSRLENAREHVPKDGHGLGPVASAFMTMSIQQSKRAGQRRRRFQITLASVALIAVVAAVLAIQQRGTALSQGAAAVQQRDMALSRQLAAESLNLRVNQPNLAKQLALAGHVISPTADTTSAIYDSLAGPGVIDTPSNVTDTAFSPNGKVLAIANGNDIQLWNRAGHAFVATLVGHTNPVKGIAFSPNGSILASVGDDQAIRLWQVSDPGHASVLAILHGTLSSLAFSPDGRTLAAGNYSSTVLRWNVTDPRHPVAQAALIGHSGAVLAVAFSPNGRLLASTSTDRTVRIWSLDSTGGRTAVATLAGDADAVTDVAFAPDSKLLASVSADETVRLWDVAVPSQAAGLATMLLDAIVPGAGGVAFAPGGDVLATAGQNVVLWDVTDPRHPAKLPTLPMGDHPGLMSTVRFTEDGSTLAGGSNNTVDLWGVSDIRRPGALAALAGQSGNVTALAYRAQQHLLVVGSSNSVANLEGSMTMWDLASPRQPRKLVTVNGIGVIGLAFNPNGRTLAVTQGDGNIRLWDVTDPSHPAPDAAISEDGASIPGRATFSVDGRMLAARWGFDSVRLWNVTDVNHPVGGHVFPYEDHLAFSSTGRIVVLGGFDGPTLAVWDLAQPNSPTLLVKLTGERDFPVDLAFSPDGQVLAGEYAGGATWLWDMTDPNHPKELSTLTGNTAGQSVTFSPDGHTVATGEGASQQAPGTIHLWDISDPHHPAVFATIANGPIAAFGADGVLAAAGDSATTDLRPAQPGLIMQLACEDSGDSITPAQWQQYISNLPYHPPCR
jgi:WD40 repeat protein